jgi:light-regulated signal transduction histidine kinase (bacteriophytochrome)
MMLSMLHALHIDYTLTRQHKFELKTTWWLTTTAGIRIMRIGLGLSICRSIVESHGGRMSVFPAHPHGSVFQVMLPISEAAANDGLREG